MLDVFVIQACFCVMCSGLRSDAVCSICVIVIYYDYVMLCSVSSGLRSDAEGKALVSSELRSDAVGKVQYVLYMLLYGMWYFGGAH